jgi:hypothetical protein
MQCCNKSIFALTKSYGFCPPSLPQDKLVKLCQERAAAVQEGSGQVVPGDAATLWQLLGVMVANKGSLRSATKPPSAGSAASVEQQIARLLLPEGQPHTMANTSQLLLPQTPSNVSTLPPHTFLQIWT